MIERELIAERTIYAIDQDGRGFEVQLKIGKPYQTNSLYGDWACPVAMRGLHGTFPDMFGIDSWQALMIARELLKTLLTYFLEDGGRLYSEKGGDEIKVDELFGAGPKETPVPDGKMTDEQLERVAKLTAKEIGRIDNSLIKDCTHNWRKVARVVGTALSENQQAIPNVPDLFYAERVRVLVREGRLESQGNLEMMRFSEVRRPSS